MKNLTITPPSGYEIDKEQSTFENIVFKPTVIALPKTWEDLGEIAGCYVHSGNTSIVGVRKSVDLPDGLKTIDFLVTC